LDKDGAFAYEGGEETPSVPNPQASIAVNYVGIAGATCRALLPTGNARDVIDNVPMTLIDNGMPVVVMRADSFGLTGHESVEEMKAIKGLWENQIKPLRIKAGALMNLGDVTDENVPKVALVGEDGNVRCYINKDGKIHELVGVLAAVSIATAALYPESPIHGLIEIPPGPVKIISIKHPTGEFDVRLKVGGTEAKPVILEAGNTGSAESLMEGYVRLNVAKVRAAMQALAKPAVS